MGEACSNRVNEDLKWSTQNYQVVSTLSISEKSEKDSAGARHQWKKGVYGGPHTLLPAKPPTHASGFRCAHETAAGRAAGFGTKTAYERRDPIRKNRYSGGYFSDPNIIYVTIFLKN